MSDEWGFLAAVEWNAIVGVANIATPIVVGAFGYLAKRAMAEIDRRQTDAELRIQRLEQNTVTKEDWLRETALARNRQEKIIEDMAELKGQNRAGTEIGAAIAAALNQQRRGDQ